MALPRGDPSALEHSVAALRQSALGTETGTDHPWPVAQMQQQFEVYDVFDTTTPAAWGLKIVLLGAAGVGKTTWVLQLREGRFEVQTRATIGVDFFTRHYMINQERYAVQFWDTAGMERGGPSSMTTSYLRGAHGVVVMLDITDQRSLAAADRWCQLLSQRDATDTARSSLLVLGNKLDRAPMARAVSVEQGLELAQRHGGWYLETTARSLDSVKSCIRYLLDDIVTRGLIGEPATAGLAAAHSDGADPHWRRPAPALARPPGGFTLAELERATAAGGAQTARSGCGC